MIKKELISKLKDFNLNTYESKIWVALLMRGSATAGKLSELTDVPRSRCYDVLESLEKKGFIMMKLGRPIKYMAISPLEAIERTKQRLLIDAEERIKLVDNIKKTSLLNELSTLHTQNSNDLKPEELTGLIRSDKNIKNHLAYMIKTANKVYLSADANFPVSLIKDALNSSEKNPKVMILTEKNNSNMKEWKTIADVKEAESLGKICITDKHAAIFLTNNSSEDSMLWINSEYSVKLLHDLFMAKWATA